MSIPRLPQYVLSTLVLLLCLVGALVVLGPPLLAAFGRRRAERA